MDLTELQSKIDHAVANSADLVLTRALELIGPCTYAEHLPQYVRTKVHLAHLDRWWEQWGDHYRRPEPVRFARYVLRLADRHDREVDAFGLIPPVSWVDQVVEEGWQTDPNNYDNYRSEIEERIAKLHAKMYRQPCLLCVSCRQRKKLWQNSPYSLLGEPQTPRAVTEARLLDQASNL